MLIIQGVCDLAIHNDADPNFHYFIGEVSFALCGKPPSCVHNKGGYLCVIQSLTMYGHEHSLTPCTGEDTR